MSITGSSFFSVQNIENTNKTQESLDEINTRVIQNTADIEDLDGRVTTLESFDYTDLYERTEGISRQDLGSDNYRTTIEDSSISLKSNDIKYGSSNEYVLEDLRLQSAQNETDISDISGRLAPVEETVAGLARTDLGGGDYKMALNDFRISIPTDEIYFGTSSHSLESLRLQSAQNETDIDALDFLTDGVNRVPNGLDYTWTISEKKVALDSDQVVFGVGGGDSLQQLRTDIDTNKTDIEDLQEETDGISRAEPWEGQFVTSITASYIWLVSDEVYYGTSGGFTIQGLRTKVNDVTSDVDTFTGGIGNNGTNLNFGSRGIDMQNNSITGANTIETDTLNVTDITVENLAVTDINTTNLGANSVVSNEIDTNLVRVINSVGDKTTELSTDSTGHFIIESEEEVHIIATDGAQTRTTKFSNDDVDFNGAQLVNFVPPYPTMKSFSVKVTVSSNTWQISYNSAYASYLVNFASSGTPISSHGQGNFSIYVASAFYGGSGTVALRDMHVSATGIFKTGGDANATILCGAPEIDLPGSGARCEFNCSRCDNPQSKTWLESTGYINIMFSCPWL